MNCQIFQMKIGEQTKGFTRRFAEKVYEGCPIYHHRSVDEVFFLLSHEIINTNRWEVVIYDENGDIGASMAIHREFDCHVGDCLSVLVAFSTGGFSLAPGYRALISIAKELNIPFIAYTHADGPYGFTLKYKKVL